VDHTITIIESQLDWLTCSNKGNDDAPLFRAMGSKLCEWERDIGGLASPFRLHNYRGFRVGRAAFGTHGESSIIALSGDLADRAFTSLLPLSTNVSRIDTAVTARVEPFDRDIGLEAFHAAEGIWLDDPRGPKPAGFLNPDAFTSFYLGGRASETYLRLYDKYGESKDDHYRACWRWEVESKGSVAVSLAVACARSSDRATFCQSYVHHSYSARGAEPPWHSDSEHVLIRGFRRRADTDRKLSWLRKYVAPSVAKLVANGKRDETTAALGL